VFILLFLSFSGCYAINMDCKFFQINSTDNVSTQCTVEKLVVTSSSDEITSVNNQPVSSGFDDKVAKIYIKDKTVEYFPRGIEKFFPNVRELTIYNSKLKVISKSDLQQFPKLTMFQLSYNDVEVLNDDLFEHNSELLWLEIESKKIKTLNATIFNPLKKLKVLSLSLPCMPAKLAMDRKKVEEIIKETRNECNKPKPEGLTRNVANRVSDFFRSFLT
jgi:hypothetical protein